MEGHSIVNSGILRQKNRLCSCVGGVLVLLSLSVHSLWGQTNQNIVGTVKDPSGATIPNVKVTVRHQQTNDTRETQTNEVGEYRVVRLTRVGLYEVKGEMAGFKVGLASNILVETGQTVRVDMDLQVGEITQSVDIKSEAPLVRTETSSLELVIQNREILELPLFGRDYLGLIALSPGAATKTTAGQAYNAVSFVSGGTRSRDNEFRLDGFRAMSNWNNDPTNRPPLDAIEEFQMVRNLYSAEYGRAMGSIVEARTKAGTNQFHGSVYEFARRGNWSAIPYFARTKPVYVEDQYGGSVGGPFWIPKVYNGKDRSFFFFAYEKFRSPSQTLMRRYTPTAAERAGDFSNSVWGPTRDNITKQPFPGNIVPLDRFSKASLSMLKQLALPNVPFDGAYNWTGNVAADQDTPNYVFRGDHRFNNKHSMYGSFIRSKLEGIQAPALDCGECDRRISDVARTFTNVTTALHYTWLASPTVVVQSHIGYTNSQDVNNQIDKSVNWTKAWGFGFSPPDASTVLHGVPDMAVTAGGGRWFGNFNSPSYGAEDAIIDYGGVVAITRGNHSVKAGTDIIRDGRRGLLACSSTGLYRSGSSGGNPMADFVQGIYQFAAFNFTPGLGEAKRDMLGFFVQDDWKIRPNLTLNLGLRYDYISPYSAPDSRVIRYDLKRDVTIYPEKLGTLLPDSEKAKLLFPHVFEGPARSYPYADKRNFAPRFGLAWRPFAGNEMVVRAGYGIFYASPQGLSTTRNWSGPPWRAFLTYGSAASPRYWDTVSPDLVAGVYTSVGDVRMPEEGFHNPYTQQWNLTLQKQLTGSMALEVGYVGSRSVHLDFEYLGKRFAPLYGKTDFAIGNSLRISTSANDAIYHAMQATLQQRFSQGLSFRANYTWGKLMNDTPEAFDNSTGNFPQYEKSREWGLSQGDLRHIFNVSGIYELPFGRGRPWGTNWHRAVDLIAGGWKTNFIFEANSGSPMDVGGGGFRPDVVPNRDANLPKSERTVDRWYDYTAFKQPTCVPCQGSLGRNAIEGPNYGNLDFGISKLFTIKENHRLEARAELFNATNHPNRYGGSNLPYAGGVSNAYNAAGAILSNAFPMRRVQLGIRYSF